MLVQIVELRYYQQFFAILTPDSKRKRTTELSYGPLSFFCTQHFVRSKGGRSWDKTLNGYCEILKQPRVLEPVG